MEPAFIKTPSDFSKVITIGQTPESLFLDFKQTVDSREPNWQPELCRDIAQFANTWGGCLLIGIEEVKDSDTGLKVAHGIKSVDDPDAVRGWVEQAINNFLVPSTLAHNISFITLPAGKLVAVNVPASRSMVYVWDRQRNTMECLRRTNHGKGWMNPDEMERQMMNGLRATKLAFLEARQTAKGNDTVEVLGCVWNRLSDNLYYCRPNFVGKILRESDGWFEIEGQLPGLGGALSLSIPFDLVHSVWVGSGGRVNVLLSVRLLYDEKSKDLVFEPIGS